MSKDSSSSKVKRVSGVTGAEKPHQEGPGYQQEHWSGTQTLALVQEATDLPGPSQASGLTSVASTLHLENVSACSLLQF